MSHRSPRPRPRAARHARGRRLASCLALLTLLAFAAAQPRAEMVLGVAGAPVAGAWNPLRALVRDAPGARLLLEIDAGGLERGEVIQRAVWTFPDASGVQRLDLDLPLPRWRRLTWRIEHGSRTLASGSVGVRQRDDRPLTLIVSAAAPQWYPLVAEESRAVPATAADLPPRAAAWDGVAAMIIDGSAAAPSADVVLAAATAGVHVLLARSGGAGHAALASLLEPGGLRVGAGGIEPLPETPAAVRAALATSATAGRVALPTRERHDLLTHAAGALPATEWMHLPRGLVAGIVSVYALSVWAVLRVGGAAGALSGLLLVAAAATLTQQAAPADTSPVREGAVVVAAGGLGVRSELREVARLPAGEVVLPGVLAPLVPLPVLWSDGVTRLPLPPGGRARLLGAPTLVSVPERLRAPDPTTAATEDAGELAAGLPADMRAVTAGRTWWLLRGTP